ncbi:hypothetical protein Shal_4195 [Shewanella halifaxensis HAW-EB4]|uniref:Uncharacterized protein n=1 Tax=Shewanella halifaxensis (strain HAW-EB4) TaxID=458817 RepID=B0TNK3_SHEHH|nr:hypothetical protein [Shewanella halifaxensis]ABZ78735.1 hypothetical protein Shal_4195 [Shewanella halifaxensis HAW-EB4]
MTKKTDATDINFKALVKQHIETQSLSGQGLARMESLLAGVETIQRHLIDESESSLIDTDAASMAQKEEPEAVDNEPTVREKSRNWYSLRLKSLIALAASVLLLVLSVQWYPEVNRQGEARDSRELAVSDIGVRIADEVAKNHIKMKPLEVQTAQLSQLRAYFTELDFTLVSSSRIDDANEMVGGRYCSIQGLTAAQIRFVDRQQSVTLYQVQYDKRLYGEIPTIESGEPPIELVVRGVAVAIWVEKGLLMASARAAH